MIHHLVDIPPLEMDHRVVGETGLLRAFCESPSGHSILAAGEDGSLHSWDPRSRESLQRYAGHTGPVVDCAYLSDTQFISIRQDGTLRLWQAESGEQQSVFVAETSMAAFAISPSKCHVLAMDIQGRAYLLQLF